MSRHVIGVQGGVSVPNCSTSLATVAQLRQVEVAVSLKPDTTDSTPVTAKHHELVQKLAVTVAAQESKINSKDAQYSQALSSIAIFLFVAT